MTLFAFLFSEVFKNNEKWNCARYWPEDCSQHVFNSTKNSRFNFQMFSLNLVFQDVLCFLENSWMKFIQIQRVFVVANRAVVFFLVLVYLMTFPHLVRWIFSVGGRPPRNRSFVRHECRTKKSDCRILL